MTISAMNWLYMLMVNYSLAVLIVVLRTFCQPVLGTFIPL